MRRAPEPLRPSLGPGDAIQFYPDLVEARRHPYGGDLKIHANGSSLRQLQASLGIELTPIAGLSDHVEVRISGWEIPGYIRLRWSLV